MGYPASYYVVPEHHTRLSDDRNELIFEQHLPGVAKEDLNVEVLEESVCMDFKPEGKEAVSRCYSLPYLVDPSTAQGSFKDGVLTLKLKLQEVMVSGTRVNLS